MPLELATRDKIYLRACILGATGSGKTATSFLFATALAKRYKGKIGIIDTQNRQSLDYVGTRFAPLGFYPIHLQKGTPLGYVNALGQFAKEGDFAVVIIDSMSDAWQGEGGVLEIAGDNAEFKDWGPAKRDNFKLMTTIQRAPFHIIATVLADTSYVISTEVRDGKTKMAGVEIVGTKPIQDRKMMPKFPLQLSMDQYHKMTVTRTSFEPYDRMIVEKPGEEWMQPLMEWMDKGDVAHNIEVTTRAASLTQLDEYYTLCTNLGIKRDAVVSEFFKKYGSKPEDCTEEFLEDRLTDLRSKRIVSVPASAEVNKPQRGRKAVVQPTQEEQMDAALEATRPTNVSNDTNGVNGTKQ